MTETLNERRDAMKPRAYWIRTHVTYPALITHPAVRLRRLRRELRLNYFEVASIVDVPAKTLRALEEGTRSTSVGDWGALMDRMARI